MTQHSQGNVIEVADVWRRYGVGAKAFDAVRGVTFAVKEGELFGLLGTNGAGKTSTIELLEGLAQPAKGTIRLFGRHDPYSDRKHTRPRTGAMLQHSGFAEQLTVAETARMWAGCTTRPRPVRDAIALVGLAHRADVQVKNLSGGEKRRLDLALATLADPDLLFLDEPTTGMDPEGRHDTWRLIKSLKDMGTTIVLTTHYLEEAEALADHLAIMHAGRIAAHGTVPQIVGEHPATLTFTLPVTHQATDLPPRERLAATRIQAQGLSLRIETPHLQHTTTELLHWARDQDVVLAGLNARSASLEEAFLHIAHKGLTRSEEAQVA
ncbi:ABC transporter ATP-binding protein [Streptomyces sp. NPDC048637]|uniref:ABC transporter ATP-binding protein n=1 Tax=Streptomyces sp. NPDC048637 TaxID=3155636 RepID=UPI0034120997